jgi:hypothetical protein
VIGKVLAAVKRRHSPHRLRSKQRKMQVVDMKVQEVEIGGALPHFVQHQRMMRNWVTDIRIEAQRTGSARNELGGGDGIPAGEKCYLMTLPDQLLSQI